MPEDVAGLGSSVGNGALQALGMAVTAVQTVDLARIMLAGFGVVVTVAEHVSVGANLAAEFVSNIPQVNIVGTGVAGAVFTGGAALYQRAQRSVAQQQPSASFEAQGPAEPVLPGTFKDDDDAMNSNNSRSDVFAEFEYEDDNGGEVDWSNNAGEQNDEGGPGLPETGFDGDVHFNANSHNAAAAAAAAAVEDIVSDGDEESHNHPDHPRPVVSIIAMTHPEVKSHFMEEHLCETQAPGEISDASSLGSSDESTTSSDSLSTRAVEMASTLADMHCIAAASAGSAALATPRLRRRPHATRSSGERATISSKNNKKEKSPKKSRGNDDEDVHSSDIDEKMLCPRCGCELDFVDQSPCPDPSCGHTYT